MIEKHETSDKVYWHKYNDFYKKRLPKIASTILEIGVFKGQSIKYWRDLYKKAFIYGVDIISEKYYWPKDDNIQYFKLDQSDIIGYQNFLKKVNTKFDIIIEDGSHDPLHQKISLMESLPFMNENSIYIIEDIHSSHKEHPLFKSRLKKINSTKNIFARKEKDYHMTLQCMLQLEHMKRLQKPLSQLDLTITNKSLFSKDELVLLYNKVKKIEIFKRTILPDYCYSCKKHNFDYVTLKCSCGVELYTSSDSMSAILYF